MFMPKTCNRCKTDNEVRNNYCYKCGEKLEETSGIMFIPTENNKSISWNFDLDLSHLPRFINEFIDKYEDPVVKETEPDSYDIIKKENNLEIRMQKYKDGVYNIYATTRVGVKNTIVAYYVTESGTVAEELYNKLNECFNYPDPVKAAMNFSIMDTKTYIKNNVDIVYEKGKNVE